MDNLAKVIDNYIASLAQIGDLAKEAIVEEVNKAVDEFEATLQKKAEKISKGIANSIQRVPTNEAGKYGFTIRFMGNLPQPKRHYKDKRSTKTITTYQGLAMLFEYGDKKHKATKFVSSSIRKLKGLDNKILDNYEKKLKEKGLT